MNMARMRAARAFAVDAWSDVQRTHEEGRAADVEQIATVRIALRHSHEVAADVASFAYKAAGGTSLRDSTLQRCFRDIHAGTQHLVVSHQIVQACGRVFLGLVPEDASWTLLGVG